MVEVTEQYIEEKKAQITALQSSLKEKEKECEELKEMINKQSVGFLGSAQQIEELKAEKERLKDLLIRLEDYFDDRADTVDGEVQTPNKEMAFLSEIRDLL